MTWKDAVGLALEDREEGYNFLYQQTYQKSYYVALKYMKQEEEAADVLQDAYIKAFQNLDQLQEPDKFPGWFSRIVASRALDELRKKKAVLFSQMQTEDSEEVSMEELLVDERVENRPELAMDREETSRLVQEMIAGLSDEQRMCVMMFYIEQMSVKNIAEVTGVSENTVKSRLKYRRKGIGIRKKRNQTLWHYTIPILLILPASGYLFSWCISDPIAEYSAGSRHSYLSRSWSWKWRRKWNRCWKWCRNGYCSIGSS